MRTWIDSAPYYVACARTCRLVVQGSALRRVVHARMLAAARAAGPVPLP